MAELGDKSDAYHRQIGDFAKSLDISQLYSFQSDYGVQNFNNEAELLATLKQHTDCLFLNKVRNYTHNFLMICSNFATLDPLKRMVQSVCCLSVASSSASLLKSNLTLIDDSYNASPSSSKYALEVLNSFTGKKIAVLGQMEYQFLVRKHRRWLLRHYQYCAYQGVVRLLLLCY
jgi:UDP-N-acetylmuramyl pentapeptide synthase